MQPRCFDAAGFQLVRRQRRDAAFGVVFPEADDLIEKYAAPVFAPRAVLRRADRLAAVKENAARAPAGLVGLKAGFGFDLPAGGVVVEFKVRCFLRGAVNHGRDQARAGQNGIHRAGAAHQHFLLLPLIRKMRALIQLDAAVAGGFRHHQNAAVLFKHERVRQVKGFPQNDGRLLKTAVDEFGTADTAQLGFVVKHFDKQKSPTVFFKQKRVGIPVPRVGFQKRKGFFALAAEHGILLALIKAEPDGPVIFQQQFV